LEPNCFVAHELGEAGIPGYLWGDDVAPYLALAQGSHMVVSCLHADTMTDVNAILTRPPLSVSEASLSAIRFALFMQIEVIDETQRIIRHRLATIHDNDSNGTGPGVWTRDVLEDKLLPDREGMLNENAKGLARMLYEMATQNIVEFSAVRAAILEYRRVNRQ
jgi:hypothetical protein